MTERKRAGGCGYIRGWLGRANRGEAGLSARFMKEFPKAWPPCIDIFHA
jgi:hypothetical protein